MQKITILTIVRKDFKSFTSIVLPSPSRLKVSAKGPSDP